MSSSLRIVTSLMGAGFALLGLLWLLAPGRAAGALDMPLLDGLARSTQVGDFAAFFLVLGASILAGIGLGRSHLLGFPAALLGSAAFCRLVAWAAHGAGFAGKSILVEIVGSVLLRAAARQTEERGMALPR